jgi:RNA polymerase sigma-70 factor (ECF subfamily)
MDDLRETPDGLLMRRYADGDGAAFDELFRRYEQRIFSFFLQRTRSRDRAADLYQQLFLRLHRARASFDPERPFAPWVFRIATRLLADDARLAFRRWELPLDGQPALLELPEQERRLERSRQVEGLLARLSSEEQRVLVAAKVAGVGYADLARDLGKSVAAVKQLASRAMRRLRTSNATLTVRGAAATERAR